MNVLFFSLFNLSVVLGVLGFTLFAESLFGVQLEDRYLFLLGLGSFLLSFLSGFFSLLISKWWIVRKFRIKVIENPKNRGEEWLIDTVKRLSKKADIKPPQVGVFEGPLNAFAVGTGGKRGLIALSVHLFEVMSPEEIEGIMAHEIAHLKFKDNVTMTLLQGTLNVLVFFLPRMFANILRLRDRDLSFFGLYLFVFLFEALFSWLALAVAMFFSRHREYRADAYAVELAGAVGIYNALLKLGRIEKEYIELPRGLKTFGFVGFLGSLFASHPPIEKRLRRIEELAKRGLKT